MRQESICSSCAEDMPRGECSASKRDCGHHCNHSWNQDECCWCGTTFGPDEGKDLPIAKDDAFDYFDADGLEIDPDPGEVLEADEARSAVFIGVDFAIQLGQDGRLPVVYLDEATMVLEWGGGDRDRLPELTGMAQAAAARLGVEVKILGDNMDRLVESIREMGEAFRIVFEDLATLELTPKSLNIEDITLDLRPPRRDDHPIRPPIDMHRMCTGRPPRGSRGR